MHSFMALEATRQWQRQLRIEAAEHHQAPKTRRAALRAAGGGAAQEERSVRRRTLRSAGRVGQVLTVIALCSMTAAVLAPAAAAGAGADRVLAREAAAASGPAQVSLSAQRLCPVEELYVPEASRGVMSATLSYGQTLKVSPLRDQIWAGVWFSGWNGPEGWKDTRASSSYPLAGAPRYGLLGRLENGSFRHIGANPTTFQNTTPGSLLRVQFRVNDDVPGNGAGAFRVYLEYPCSYL